MSKRTSLILQMVLCYVNAHMKADNISELISQLTNPLVKKTTNIWLDVDPGYGDGVAMFLGAYSEQFQLKGVTVSYGNTSRANGVFNGKIMLSQFGKTDVPLYKGAEYALNQYKYVKTDNFHKDIGVPDSVRENHEKQSLVPEAGHSQHDLYLGIMSQKNKITYITLGPNTTLALLFKAYPEVRSQIERIVIMGGGVDGGNVTKWAEFNIYQDPEAFNIVQNSGIETIMMTMETQADLTYQQKDIDMIRSFDTAAYLANEVVENTSGVGIWGTPGIMGGSCTCPDGQVYQVGDNNDFCGSLACIGGTPGTCNNKLRDWSRRKVTCGQKTGGHNKIIHIIAELFQACADSSAVFMQDPNLYDHGVFPVLFNDNYCEKIIDVDFTVVLDGEKRGQTIFIEATDEVNRNVKLCTKVNKTIFNEWLYKLIKDAQGIDVTDGHCAHKTMPWMCEAMKYFN